MTDDHGRRSGSLGCSACPDERLPVRAAARLSASRQRQAGTQTGGARARAEALLRSFGVLVAAGLVFLAPLSGGAHDRAHWTLAAAACALLGAVALLVHGLAPRTPALPGPALVALGVVLGLTLLQLVTLPAWVVGLLSPARLDLAKEAARAAGEAPPGCLPLTTCLGCTRDSALLLAAYISAFSAGVVIFSRGRAWKIVFGAAATAASILAVHGLARVIMGQGERLSSTYTNANRFAGLMALSIGCAVGILMAGRERRRRSDRGGTGKPPLTCHEGMRRLSVAAAGVMGLALLLTISRLGIASAVAAGLLTVAIFGRFQPRRAVPAALTACGVVCAVITARSVSSRSSEFADAGASAACRLGCWRDALPLARDYALTGSGAGTFKHVFASYQAPPLTNWYRYAHNEYLNLFSDVGIVGLAAGLVAVGLVLHGIVSLRRSSDRDTMALGVSSFLGLSAVLLHSVGDFPLQEPATAVLFFIVAGTAYGACRRQRRAGRGAERTQTGARWRLPVACALATAICVVTLPPLLRLREAGALASRASMIPAGGRAKVGEADLHERLDLLERAAELDRWDAGVRYEAARMRVRLAIEGAYAPGDRGGLPGALRALRQARAISLMDPRLYYLEAMLLWRPGDAEIADRMMRFAVRLAPAWRDVAYRAGSYFLMRWASERAGPFPADASARLFAWMSEGLSLAARSPLLRDAIAERVIARGLSPVEIDAALAPDAAINEALARVHAGRGENALACWRYGRALEAPAWRQTGGDPWRPPRDVRIAYARSLLATGATSRALQQFDLAIRSSTPGKLDGTLRAMASLRSPPRDSVALADYWASAGERLGPAVARSPSLLLARGRAELAAGRDDAAYVLLHGYARRTRDASLFAELATAAFARGESGFAAYLAAEAASCDPADASHRLLQARALASHGRDALAAAAYMEALRLKPRGACAARELAAIEMRNGRHPEAIAVWRRFLEAGGDGGTAHEALAGIHASLLDRRAR